jgi:hypothetical protein
MTISTARGTTIYTSTPAIDAFIPPGRTVDWLLALLHSELTFLKVGRVAAPDVGRDDARTMATATWRLA